MLGREGLSLNLIPMPLPRSSRAGFEPARHSVPVRPSIVTLPGRCPDGVASLLDFFRLRFPRISEATWRERFANGKVWADTGAVTAGDAYVPGLRLHYRREVAHEPPVRTDVRIVWHDDDLLVVDKPPHLPVTPGGRWVRGCLLHLLAERTDASELAPLHRLDRLTSGLVVLSRNPATRAHVARLFQRGAQVEKVYTAVCEPGEGELLRGAVLEHHLARSASEYWRQVVRPDRPPNAISEIDLEATAGGLALYRVRPHTGRKHQIRVQLAAAGLPILGDPLYGRSPFHDPDDLATRMWLDAHLLRVDGFPSPDGRGPLTVEWRSSREPDDLLRRAAASRR